MGDRVVRREVWRGRVWTGLPMYVVEDSADLLALYLPSGAPIGFAPGRWPIATDRHPWDVGDRPTWWGHGVLHLHRPGEPYCVIVFWEGADRRFSRWYLNFQEPFVRHGPGIETLDHVLDIVVAPDGSWRYKDLDELAEAVALGLFDEARADRVRRAGAAAGAALDRGERWWDDAWSAWVPPPELDRPFALPAAWTERPVDSDGVVGLTGVDDHDPP